VRCGYKYVNEDGTHVHLVCNRNKQWWRREFAPREPARWQKISPPTIIDGHLRQGGDFIKVAVLQNCPVDLPRN